MRTVPWWGLASSGAAPLLLIGGWTVAAAAQPIPFDAGVRTISELAGNDAAQRWMMTIALAGVGLSHVVTAGGLRCAEAPGRLVLAFSGVATLLVAAFPLPPGGRFSSTHTAAAALALISLAVWPAFAWTRGTVVARQSVAALLRPQASATATVILLLLLGWFFVEQLVGGPRVGLAERVAAGAQSIWPLAVVLSARRVTPTVRTVGVSPE